MAESPEEYLAAVPEAGRPWLREFWDHVAVRNPDLELTMFRGVPMFKFADSYLKGYVMFTAAATHFAAHSLQFDLIAETKAAIPGAFGGKGNVSVKYKNTDAIPALKSYVDAVLAAHDLLP